MSGRYDPGWTRRDAAGPVNRSEATRREDRSGPEPATRRESGGVRISLPDVLTDRFEEVDLLPGGGAEGFVFVCRDRDHDGQLCAVKVYGRGITPDPRVHEALAAVADDPDVRVVRLHDALTVGQTVVEVLEWAGSGSLDQFLGPGRAPLDAGDLIENLWRALSDFQRVIGGGHFDVKPANVLVRSVVPLELVLGDLGLARAMEATIHFTSRALTAAYAPPEAFVGGARLAKTLSWDWWSVGMIAAEAVLGHHPLALPDGHLPPEMAFVQLPEVRGLRPIDLTGVGDSGVRALCGRSPRPGTGAAVGARRGRPVAGR